MAAKPTTAYKKLWSVLEMLRAQKGMDYETLAVKAHCTIRTTYNDRQNPEKMPIERMLRYFKAVGAEPEKVVQSIAVMAAQL